MEKLSLTPNVLLCHADNEKKDALPENDKASFFYILILLHKRIRIFVLVWIRISNCSLFTVLALGCTPKEEGELDYYPGYEYDYEKNTSIEDSNNDTIMIVDDLANAEDIKI